MFAKESEIVEQQRELRGVFWKWRRSIAPQSSERSDFKRKSKEENAL